MSKSLSRSVSACMDKHFLLFTEPGDPIKVGLVETHIVVREGDSFMCCVEIFFGIAEDTHQILIASITDTASGLSS